MDKSESWSTDLTAQEQAQWLMARMHPGDTRYNIGLAVGIRGDLRLDALRFAWQRLVGRHELLRTTYVNHQSKAAVVCHPDFEVPIALIDGQGLGDEAVKARIDSWFDSPFDLLQGPCLRLGCFIRSRQEHVLVVCAHHIITDFISLCLLLDELESLYLDEIGSDLEHWRDSSVPFAEYRLQASSQDKAQASASQAYWYRYLGQVPAPLDWPDHWRQGATTTASHYLTVDGERLHRLRRLAEETGGSLYASIIGTWAVAVSRACAQSDVIVGMPMSMRDATFARTLGSLFNVLPLRVRVAGSLHELVQGIRRDLHEALDHRAFDLAAALDALSVPRPAGRNPLFQTTVNLLGQAMQSRWLTLQMAGPDTQAQWAGLEIGAWPLDQQQGQVDIALELVDAHDCLRCVIKADNRSFSTSGLERFAAHWLNTVDALLGEEGVLDDSAPTASGQDYNQVPGTLNALPSLTMRMPSLVAWFDAHVARHPDAEAVRDHAEALDYRNLQARSVKLARHLVELGVAPGERVGVQLVPGVDALVAMLAIMRVGACYVPLDPTLPTQRTKHVVRQSGIGLVIGDSQVLAGRVQGVQLCSVDMSRPEGTQSSEPVFDLSGPDTPAYSVFTSGSTGLPKGIDVAQRNVVALLESMYAALQLPDRLVWSWAHAASFDLSVWEIWGALCSAGCLVVVPQEVRSRPDLLIASLDQHRINVITQTPSGLRQLSGVLAKHPPLLAAQHWVVCGEALPGAVARRYLSDLWTLWNLYGPTETTVFASIERVTAALAEEVIVPIGRPLALATMYLRDGQACPALGTVGEIMIGGAGVSLGYVGLDKQNRERFVADPYRAGAQAYRTGDLGYWDGERLRFAGRIDEQVKFNGYRIELGEIERCLESLAQVQQAAALIEEVAEQSRLVALVQWRDEAIVLDEQTLREHLRHRLPAYMLPTRLIGVESLPMNRHSKLDRKAIRQMLEGLSLQQELMLASDGNWHQRIQAIWCEVLGRTEVGLDDAFFDLGGNSMALLQVHDCLQQWPEAQHLRPSDLFRLVTPRMLGDVLQRVDASASASYQVQDSRKRREKVVQRRHQHAEGVRHE